MVPRASHFGIHGRPKVTQRSLLKSCLTGRCCPRFASTWGVTWGLCRISHHVLPIFASFHPAPTPQPREAQHSSLNSESEQSSAESFTLLYLFNVFIATFSRRHLR